MPPSLLSDAALVTRGRPAPSRASDLRIDAMLLTRGREGSASLLAAAPGSPLSWIERTATFAPHRIATEVVAAGLAMPLSQRFQRQFSLSVDAHAEVAARARVTRDPALAVLLYTCGLPTGDPLPPSTHTRAPAERAILVALRETVGTAARLAG